MDTLEVQAPEEENAASRRLSARAIAQMASRQPFDENAKRVYVAGAVVFVGVAIFSASPVLRWMLLGLVVGGAVLGALLIFWKERD